MGSESIHLVQLPQYSIQWQAVANMTMHFVHCTWRKQAATFPPWPLYLWWTSPPASRWRGDSVGPRKGLDVLGGGRGTCSVPASNRTPVPPVVQPVTHRSNPRPAATFVNYIYIYILQNVAQSFWQKGIPRIGIFKRVARKTAHKSVLHWPKKSWTPLCSQIYYSD